MEAPPKICVNKKDKKKFKPSSKKNNVDSVAKVILDQVTNENELIDDNKIVDYLFEIKNDEQSPMKQSVKGAETQSVSSEESDSEQFSGNYQALITTPTTDSNLNTPNEQPADTPCRKRHFKENFVKLNLKRKKFTKFSKTFNFSKTKRKNFWKTSHNQSNAEINDTEQPTELENGTESKNSNLSFKELQKILPPCCPDDFKTESQPFSDKSLSSEVMDDLILEEMLKGVCSEFGINNLKEEQLKAINRILHQSTTLLIAPTNFGKSLCYQIPSLILYRLYRSITIVICPLISLMQDQLDSLHHSLKGVALHSGIAESERKDILYRIGQKEYAVVFIAPEALTYGALTIIDSFPQISFVCIDEVHCLATWSHNFRPAYLMVINMLVRHCRVRCFLGLTATLNDRDMKNVLRQLNIKDSNDCVINAFSLRDNISMDVKSVEDKMQYLFDYLKDRVLSNGGILIFCRKRATTEAVASFLRVKFRSMINSHGIENYHAGMNAKQRKNTQEKYLNDFIRILVCTTAFGMGFNKPNIRIVIHYDAPSSIEQFIQEIGRAGRDGLPCSSLILLDNNIISEINSIKAFVYESALDIKNLSRLFGRILAPMNCNCSQPRTHIIGLDKESITIENDAKLETIETILHHLENIIVELDNGIKFKVISTTDYSDCRLTWYSSISEINNIFYECLPLKFAAKNATYLAKSNYIDINLVAVADYFKTTPREILKNIMVYKNKFKNLLIENTSKQIILKTSCSKIANIQETVFEKLCQHMEKNKNEQLNDIDNMFATFTEISKQDSGLKMRDYIYKAMKSTNYPPSSYSISKESCVGTHHNKAHIEDATRSLIHFYPDYKFSPFSIARIYHGIDSLKFPSAIFGKDSRFWHKFIDCSFEYLLDVISCFIIQHHRAGDLD